MELIEKLDVRQLVYDYLENQKATYDEALAEAAAKAAVWSLKRQLMEDRKDSKGKLRPSNSGPCARKIGYGFLGIPEDGKLLDARARITFLNGDFVEIIAVALMRLAGIQMRATCLDDDGQEQVEFKVREDLIIKGSPDGILDPQPGLTERTLLEVKSSSDYGFNHKFAKGIVDDGYKLQHNVYLEATGIKQGLFVAINKNSGELCHFYTEYDPDYVKWARRNQYWASIATPDDMPPRYSDGDAFGPVKDKKSGGYKLGALCTYCPHFGNCWGRENLELEFRSGKPVWLLKEFPEDYDSSVLDEN